MNPLQTLRGHYVSRNVNRLHDETATVGDRLSDGLARFGGSWTFIILFGTVLALWMGINSLQLLVRPFDPFPFIFLNLVLSCLAAVQAPVILMSQNRQAARDRLAAEQDFATNLKAEVEVERLHEKLDHLLDRQWFDLLELQQHQIELLNRLLDHQGVALAARPNGTAREVTGSASPGRDAIPSEDGDQSSTSSNRSTRRPRRARIVEGNDHAHRPRGADEPRRADA